MDANDVTIQHFGNPNLCSCRTFLTEERWPKIWNEHGYCSSCGGFAPEIFRTVRGERKLNEYIGKLEEHRRKAMRSLCFDFKRHEQVMACLSCLLAGFVPEPNFPQEPGLWEHPCPRCGASSVWVTEPRERKEGPEGEELRLAVEHLAKAETGIEMLKNLLKGNLDS